MTFRKPMLATILAAASAPVAPAQADNIISHIKAAPETAATGALSDGWAATVTPATPPHAAAIAAAPANVASKYATVPKTGATAGAAPLRGTPPLNGAGHALAGLASYYSDGELTASGEPFDKHALTAAHRTLPFGTRVRVTRPETGSSVVVRINDRGPFKPGRVIDLSELAAQNLGITSVGLSAVQLQILGK